jgi:hypothetical protein
MSQIVPNGYIKDEETGYLTSLKVRSGTPFGVDSKKKFLALMEEEGGFAKCCDLLGVSSDTLYHHLSIDESFSRDYTICVRRMASKLESVMFKNGQRPQGYMDRITWLRRYFPKDWTPKTQVNVTNETGSIDELFGKLEADGKLIHVDIPLTSESKSE